MDEAIGSCASLWTLDYVQKVVNVLKAGKGGKSLSRGSYHILKTYKLVALGGVDKVAKMLSTEHYTVCELVRKLSICGGQGYVRCHCRINCLTKRCSCLKKGLRCNSACHSHKSCDNVDK